MLRRLHAVQRSDSSAPTAVACFRMLFTHPHAVSVAVTASLWVSDPFSARAMRLNVETAT